ncbi:flagellum-associated coiled-coil domain-containing protein 1 isoform X2 [Dipodomys merriami]|uniref:flagellum-associated coiled-coil domain-containing protein 1 isoform X2 n=1 Tax=Dipodomys merriami TaxID=94247 RepID=UPI00385575E3
MNPNPLIYCTCWDPWNIGPRKLIKTPQPPNKNSSGRSKLIPLVSTLKEHNFIPSQSTVKPLTPKVKAHLGRQGESSKIPTEVINVSPGYQLVRNREQISVTLGDEMFNRKKHLDSGPLDKVAVSRIEIISDLEEQISELTTIIDQMNRDHLAAQKLLSTEMDRRCAELKQHFENMSRELTNSHKVELGKLENNYKEALKAEKSAAQEKLEEMEKEYKYLKNMFHIYQDSIYDEMEDRWSKRKAEWEKDEKLEREKILLQQKHKMAKRFELESEEEKKKINKSYSDIFENFIREKEELMKQHEKDTLQLQELKKTNETIEEELHAQALVLESLNTSLYQTQMELQKEKATVGNMEKILLTKLADAEEKYKYTIQNLIEENTKLKEQINAKNEEIGERTFEGLASIAPTECDCDLEDSNKKQTP